MKLLPVLLMLLWGSCLLAQDIPAVDFLHAKISIEVKPEDKSIKGEVTYTFKVLRETDSVALNAMEMVFGGVMLNNRKVKYRNDGKLIHLKKKLKAGNTYELFLEYTANPEQTVYFIGWDGNIPDNNQVWTQGQGKYSSHWVPSFDKMTEKVEFDLSITFNKDYEVVANGKLLDTKLNGDRKTWMFDMQQPMSSYLLAFAIGKYKKRTLLSAGGIPLLLYYYPGDSLKLEPTYRYSRRIFDFLEKEIGVPYPWRNYRQVPVRDFLYAGMENTGCTLFSDGYVIDSVAFKDRNYVNINAHELAHQWFGNLVTEESGRHHWLHEGFATYYAYLAEKDIFGDEYFYWHLYDTARALDQMSEEDGGEALTNPGAGSLTFYEKGAWALYMLHDLVGDRVFKKGIQVFLERYAYRNATVDDFLEVMESSSGISMAAFKDEWLDGDEFPYHRAIDHLASSCESLKQFLLLKRELIANTGPGEPIIKKYWEENSSLKWQEAVVRTYFSSLSEGFLRNILHDGDLKVRQAVAQETVQIPSTLKPEYETLLSDGSYITKEAALYKLWIYFDEDRASYLDRCRDIIGLPNLNLRMLWLTLALLTPGFDEDHKAEYFNELSGYTSPEYGFEIRQLAFEYLKEAFTFTDTNLKDLVNACVHHSWQFRNFARNLLNELLNKEHYLERVRAITKELKGEDLRYLKQKLEAK